MTTEQELFAAHRAWLGNLIEERVGLVVTAPALVRAQVYLDKTTLPELGQRFFSFLPNLSGKSARDVQKAQRTRDDAALDAVIEDVPAFLCDFLGWPRERLAGAPGGPALSTDLVVRLENFGDDTSNPPMLSSTAKANLSSSSASSPRVPLSTNPSRITAAAGLPAPRLVSSVSSASATSPSASSAMAASCASCMPRAPRPPAI